MDSFSELDAYLQSQSGEGRVDSSGVFTLERQAALEKLSRFQLPDQHSWAVKVVQAAVTGGSQALQIRQGISVTTFVFEGGEFSSSQEFEQAFLDPRPSGHRSLDHLIVALFSVGFGRQRAFQFSWPNSDQSLVWTGQELRRVRRRKSSLNAQLCVSHRAFNETVSAALKFASLNAALLMRLKEWAFTCPIPLSVDGLRVDRLQNCPSQGESAGNLPVALGWASASIPPLSLPPGTFSRPAQVPTDASVACLITAHLTGKYLLEQDPNHSSCVYWVVDGVVGDVLLLDHFDSVTCAVIVSAEGLGSDASGLTLIRTPEMQDRTLAALSALTETVRAASLDLQKRIRRGKLEDVYEGGLCVVASGVTLWGATLVLPFLGVGSLCFGAMAYKFFSQPGARHKALEQKLREALSKLQSSWPLSTLSAPAPRTEFSTAKPARGDADPGDSRPRWKRNL